jgi:hypothetical protein
MDTIGQTHVRFANEVQSVEFTGSETFVKEQIAAFRDGIVRLLAESGKSPKPGKQPAPGVSKAHDRDTADDERDDAPSEYPNVLEISGNTVHVLKIPSGGRPARAAATVLLILLANKIAGVEEVAYADVRDEVEGQGCLDAPNFARIFKEEPPKGTKGHVIVTGSLKGNSTLKLSRPGETAAKALAATLNKAA